MKFYNTLTRKKEEFTTVDGTNKVRMYSCGPTVYSFAHIGNMRTYVFMDLLRRALQYEGYKVKGVMNVTDVGHLLSDGDDGEDKMQKAAKEQHKSPYEIAAFYSGVFFEDLKKLNVQKPEITPKATEHIDCMLDFVEKLVEKGYGYETSDGIYFDISKANDYGKLSGAKLDEQKAGARVEVNDEKRHPADFALWKKAPKEHIMQWDSPWGKSYPGWHIECSAMSRKYLGEQFDIHTGGVDHIPIHHENEIAQSEALTGKIPARFWMHGEFMQVDGGKMSKSLGNTYTISQLEERGYRPMDFRYMCLNAHYRKKLNFTFEVLDGAKTAYDRLLRAVAAHKNGANDVKDEVIAEYKKQFEDAICDDLNVPQALGVLWTMLKLPASKKVYEAALDFDRVFGLSLDKAEQVVAEEEAKNAQAEIPENVAVLAEKMQSARMQKDYAAADALRAEIDGLGYSVLNTKEGYTLKAKK
ncbi:MAG: cysteine--tRNA ligase [Candidatus Borkfalkiaceae bacterium]|nr:cysteine--tRNA ligase [Christensenellaceae bacterium]